MDELRKEDKNSRQVDQAEKLPTKITNWELILIDN